MTMMMTTKIVDNFLKDCSHHKYASNVLQAKCSRPALLLLLHHHHDDHDHEHDDDDEDNDGEDNDDNDNNDGELMTMMQMIQLFVVMASLLPTVLQLQKQANKKSPPGQASQAK